MIGCGEKKLSGAEKQNYGRTNRSLHYTKSLEKNSIITKNDIAILRTEKKLTVGDAPDKFDFYIGAVLQHSVSSGKGVIPEDFIVRG